jgi:multiple sugar transport system permease protein
MVVTTLVVAVCLTTEVVTTKGGMNVATLAQQTQASFGRKSKRQELWKQLKKTWQGYLFISPAAILIMVFSYLAIGFSLYISFSQYDIISETHPFIGLDNYRRAFADELVGIGFRNTAFYVVVIVPSITILSLLLAVLGNQVHRARSSFRTIFFIPTITPIVVTSLLWVWLLEPTGGINKVLRVVGIHGPNWLFDTNTALPAIMVMTLWGAVGYYMVIFLAGLAEIPQVFYEAAKVDGASPHHTFWYITIPLLRNSLIFVVVTLTIAAFQMFTQAFIMTKGGPINATQTVQLVIYRYAFAKFEVGYASSISWLLFGVIFFFSALQLKLFISRELY